MPSLPSTGNPTGRPKAYLDPDRVRELSALGLSQEQAAHRLGCSQRTLAFYIASDPVITEAWRGGKAKAIETAAKTIYDRGLAGSDACLIFWLKCQANWAPPKQDIKITMTPAGPLIDGHISDLANHHAALLDGPDLDSVPDAEIVE